MAGFEAGGGAPWEAGGVLLYDSGAGDDTPPYLDLGGGDPWGGPETATIIVSPPAGGGGDSDEDPTPSRYPDGGTGEYSQEGGWIVELLMVGDTWPEGSYRVDLVAATDGQIYPKLKPGCNSAKYGLAQSCRPTKGFRALRFALPAAPVGVYDIKITYPEGSIVVIEDAITLTYVPDSAQVRSMLFLPDGVYSPKNLIPGGN